MTTQALSAGDNTVVNTDTYVSWNGAGLAIANLPEIDDGAGATVAKNYELRVESIGDGDIEIKTADGRRVGYVPGWAAGVVVAEKGETEEPGEKDFWRFSLLPASPAAHNAAPAAADAWAVLVANGFVKAE